MIKVWTDYLKSNAIEWLLESNPWTKYRTLVDLLDKKESDPEVIEAKQQLLEEERVIKLESQALEWFPVLSKRHDDPKMSHYKLRMLSDFGLTCEDKNIQEIINKAKIHKEDNLFTIKQELPQIGQSERSDGDEWHALPCDSPLITYTLISLGDHSEEVMKTVDLFKEKWEKAEGWFCDLFFVKGQHKKLQVGCPMAGLFFWKLCPY